MEFIDYSEKIRERFILTIQQTCNLVGSMSLDSIKELMEKKDDDRCDIISSYSNKNYTLNILNSTYLLKTQMFVDYFRLLKFEDTIYGAKRLEDLPIIEDYEDINYYAKNNKSLAQMLEAMMVVYEASNYEKILMAKCLDTREKRYLEKLHPYFKSEQEMYDIDVDLDYVMDQIDDEYTYLKDDKAYDRASSFLFDLHKLDKEKAEKIFIELFDQDLGIISSTYESDDTIRMGQVVLRRDNLALMLKDYHKYQVKTLGLDDGEEDV